MIRYNSNKVMIDASFSYATPLHTKQLQAQSRAIYHGLALDFISV